MRGRLLFNASPPTPPRLSQRRLVARRQLSGFAARPRTSSSRCLLVLSGLFSGLTWTRASTWSPSRFGGGRRRRGARYLNHPRAREGNLLLCTLLGNTMVNVLSPSYGRPHRRHRGSAPLNLLHRLLGRSSPRRRAPPRLKTGANTVLVKSSSCSCTWSRGPSPCYSTCSSATSGRCSARTAEQLIASTLRTRTRRKSRD